MDDALPYAAMDEKDWGLFWDEPEDGVGEGSEDGGVVMAACYGRGYAVVLLYCLYATRSGGHGVDAGWMQWMC